MPDMISLSGYTLGILSIAYGMAMLIPLGYEVIYAGTHFESFAISILLCLLVGGALFFANHRRSYDLLAKQAFLLTSLSWIWMSLLGALPFFFAKMDMSLVDMIFESVSGLTTTGSTVLTNLDAMDPGLLLWRSIIQWLGGFGIIAFAIILLPVLRVGGMQLFHSESSDNSSKAIPLTGKYLQLLVSVYLILSILCFGLYATFGMSLFDAFNHMMTTVSTGGFSTHDDSFGHFDSIPLKIIGALFMLGGGIPFVLFVKLVVQGQFTFHRDEQVVTLLFIILYASILVTVSLILLPGTFEKKLIVDAFFNVISIITTTGYADGDYQFWGGLAVAVFFIITFLGSCSGSTAGGLKIFRIVLMAKVLYQQLRKLIYPRGVFPLRYNEKPVEGKVINSIMAFFFIYILSNIVIAMLLALTGLDFVTSLSGAATAIANVGPGLGEIIGPSGNFASIPDTAKWILCAAMIAGRLEILTFVVIFVPAIWRP